MTVWMWGRVGVGFFPRCVRCPRLSSMWSPFTFTQAVTRIRRDDNGFIKLRGKLCTGL